MKIKLDYKFIISEWYFFDLWNILYTRSLAKRRISERRCGIKRYSYFVREKWWEICISLKIKRNQCDRPPWRHWLVTFVSTGFVLTIYVTQMFDTRIRFTFFVRCCLFRFSCSAHGYTCEGNSTVAGGSA